MTNPNLPPPTNSDVSQLQTLSIFFYILAGLQALGMCLGIGYIIFGVFFGVVAGSGGRDSSDAAAATGFISLFGCIGVFIVLVAGTFAFLNFKAAQGLRNQKNYTLCFVMAVIVCLNIPLGTILGIFTILALNKPHVKAMFR